MKGKAKYRVHLIDRDGCASPVAMRVSSKRWKLDCSTCYRQVSACDFYWGLTQRFLQKRWLEWGNYALRVKRPLPVDFGPLPNVICRLFMRNDESKGYLLHRNTWKTTRNNCFPKEPYALYFNGELHVGWPKKTERQLIYRLLSQLDAIERPLTS